MPWILNKSSGNKNAKKKLVVGWFSFTCSEDSTIMFLELLNDSFFDWKSKIEFRYCRFLKSKNELKDLDVAFVEGAISTQKELDSLKEVRKNCKKLVAIGACAVYGRPASQRNEFDVKTKKEIDFILKRFGYLDKVLALNEVVKVDENVPGCPMNTEKFKEILNKYLMEFKVV